MGASNAEARHLEEGIELNSAQVAKLRDIRQSAVRRLILFGLLICSAGWVLFQTYSFSNLLLEAQIRDNKSQTIFQQIEALSALLGFMAFLSVCFGLLLLGFATAASHFFSAHSLIRTQEMAIASANCALREALSAQANG